MSISALVSGRIACSCRVHSENRPIPNEMQNAINSAGLQLKKSIVDDHLAEVVNNQGSSIVIWSGEEDLGYDLPHKKSGIRAYTNHFHEHAKNHCGLYVEHPGEGVHICHHKQETSLGPKHAEWSQDVRVLPLVTMAELQHDSKAALHLADKVASRLSGAISLTVGVAIEDYDVAHAKLSKASHELLETQDKCFSVAIREMQQIRDKYDAHTPFSDEDTAKMQKHEKLLEKLHSHSDELRQYVQYMSDVAARLEALTGELSGF